MEDRLPMIKCNFQIFDKKKKLSNSVSIWTHISILMLRLSSVDSLLLNDTHSRFYNLATHCSNLAWDDLITLQVQVNKENLIESSFISCTLLIQLLHGLCTIFPHSSCDLIMWHCDTVTWHFPVLLMYSKSKRKEKEKKYK